MALASYLSATYGLPQQFDIIIDGERRAVRSVWRTCTEMGVMFADESPKPADFLECKRDVASLIEPLKMAEEKWPNPGNDEISESKCSAGTRPCLRCGRKRAAALVFRSVSFRLPSLNGGREKWAGPIKARAATLIRARVFQLFCEDPLPVF